jgi:predicted transcriptional regulator
MDRKLTPQQIATIAAAEANRRRRRDKRIEELADEAPELTIEQREQLAALLAVPLAAKSRDSQCRPTR